MPMEIRTIPASVFKQKCLALLDQVELTGVPIIVTKHGRPVAKVAPLEDRDHRSTQGSLTVLTDDEEDLFSTGIGWPTPDLPA